MYKTILMFALSLSINQSYAEMMNCNMGENALFPMINLDTETKSAMMTDRSGKNADGKITLIRNQGKEKTMFNVSLEYKINNITNYIDLIIIHATGETYKVGMAGYIEKNKKKILDIVANDDAMCF